MPVVLNAEDLQDKDMKNVILGAEVYTDAKDASGNIIRVAVNRYAGKINGDDAVARTYTTTSYDDATNTFTKTGSVTVNNTPLQLRNDTRIAAANTYTAFPTGDTATSNTSGLAFQGATTNAVTAGTSVTSALENDKDLTDTRLFGSKAFDVNNTATSNSYRAISSTNNAAGNMTYADAAKFENIKLDNVQYGRVSNNIDALSSATIGSEIVSGQKIVGTSPLAFNDPHAVNTYFYRGINQSTLPQMAALDQKGMFTYYGHALTYGINGDLNASSGLKSNSAGASQTVTTLGDFVKATYDVANKRVTGDIYNVKYTNGTSGVENNLINFKGDVNGNTVVGSSTNVANGQVGALKASFYGDQAQELGGAVNSIATDTYGTSTWGGVFGAKRDIAPTPTNSGNIATPTITNP